MGSLGNAANLQRKLLLIDSFRVHGPAVVTSAPAMHGATMIKQSIFRVARSGLFSTLVSLLEKLERRPNLLRVLTYHRVDHPDARPDLDPDLISATPEDFARQMEHLAERHHVVSIEQVLQAIRGGCRLPPRSVLITFDDAYCDFWENAWPTLRRLRLPAVMFVPTSFPDQPRRFWWDTVHAAMRPAVADRQLAELGFDVVPRETPARRYARVVGELKRLPHDEVLARVAKLSRPGELPALPSPVMTWDELRELAAQGLTLGAHTRTHPLLNRVPVDAAVEEAVGSLRDLRSRVPGVPSILAYPGGAFSGELVRRLRGDFELAFTTCRGINELERADALLLRRINVSRHAPGSLVRAQMLAGLRHFNRHWAASESLPSRL